MTKDFAKSASKERSSNGRNARNNQSSEVSTSPPLKPFIAGCVFGICLCLGTQWLMQKSPNEPLEAIVETIDTESVTAPVLTFYQDLKKVEVKVPESEPIVAEEQSNIEYLLQAGSFKDPKDADSLRAQLILLNMTTDIRKFNHNGELYHRVFAGPFTERAKMSKAKTTLLENGIESLPFTQEIKN